MTDANLHLEGAALAASAPARPPTRKQLAVVFNVSERLVAMAAKVSRLRPDLEADIMAGTMSVNEAHRIATGSSKPTSWDRLARAWNNATDDDRSRLLIIVRAAL